MQRIAHGSTSQLDAEKGMGATAADEINVSFNFLNSPAPSTDVSRLDYLFPDLAKDPESLLPESPKTLEDLGRLGESMRDPGDDANFNSTIPSAYTYFGQFVDHDITFTKIEKTPPELSDSCVLGNPQLTPMAWDEIRQKCKNQQIMNRRASILELDSVYGSVSPDLSPPRNDNLMGLGKVSPNPKSSRVKGKEDDNDLPRLPPNEAEPKKDRLAQIGDPRNDQTLTVSQLHVAFLRAHNAIVAFLRAKALVKPEHEFEEAQKLLRQHYHWIVIHDFLREQISDPDIVDEVLSNPDPVYNPPPGEFFLPLEFTIAAYRFGHSMIRSTYYLNDNIPVETLGRLFTLTALSNTRKKPTPGRGFPTLPENKIIQWRGFLKGGKNVARQINTRLVEPLFGLLDETDQPVPCESSLAVQDLKRGYMMRIPTGQAIAKALKLPVMSAPEIEAVAANKRQASVLRDSGFSSRTPLWFYILAEAAHHKYKGNRLGPVGSRLVAEVIIGLVRRSKDSILAPDFNPPGGFPSLGTTPGQFTLLDLLHLAGVLEDKKSPNN